MKEEGRAECISKSEEERDKYRELVLCPNGSRDCMDDGQGLGLALHARLEEAAQVKAKTTAPRNKNNSRVRREERCQENSRSLSQR